MPSDVHLVATWAAPLEGVPLNERLAAADWTADSEGFLDPRSVATVESTHIRHEYIDSVSHDASRGIVRNVGRVESAKYSDTSRWTPKAAFPLELSGLGRYYEG